MPAAPPKLLWSAERGTQPRAFCSFRWMPDMTSDQIRVKHAFLRANFRRIRFARGYASSTRARKAKGSGFVAGAFLLQLTRSLCRAPAFLSTGSTSPPAPRLSPDGIQGAGLLSLRQDVLRVY